MMDFVILALAAYNVLAAIAIHKAHLKIAALKAEFDAFHDQAAHYMAGIGNMAETPVQRPGMP